MTNGVVNATLFKPSIRMQRAMWATLRPTTPATTIGIAEASGLHRATYYRWLKKKGFREWWKSEWSKQMGCYEHYFDKVGMLMAPNDYRYWKVMQKKYFLVCKQI
jgi:hypothetical protein